MLEGASGDECPFFGARSGAACLKSKQGVVGVAGRAEKWERP